MRNQRRVRAKWVVLTAAAINALLVIALYARSYAWTPAPGGLSSSGSTDIGAEVAELIAWILCIPLAVLLTAIVFAGWKEHREQIRQLHACKFCGYDRKGLAEGAACPECGKGPGGTAGV